MCGPELGIQLLFIPEAYSGMGGGAFDVYRICEAMARIDLGIATGVLATFLGSDPIAVGGTAEQKKQWLTPHRRGGLLMAYGATEPAAGSDLAALRTTAERVDEDGRVIGYKLNGPSSGSATAASPTSTPCSPTPRAARAGSCVEKGAPGLSHGKPEDKHGIRASNTAALSLEDVYVPSRGWSAASRARACCRRRRCSATRG